MTAATQYRMLDKSSRDGFIPREDMPIIGAALDARSLSYDMALALRTEPYSMTQFIEDLATGNITTANVEMRRHFVMRDMADTNGPGVTVTDFEAQLIELATHGALSKSQLMNVDDAVLRELKLNLVLA